MARQLALLWAHGKAKKYRKGNSTPFEEVEQCKLVHWLKKKGIKFYAVPNGGYRSYSEASRLRKGGVSPGVPDLCIPYPVKPYHGLYIELKRQSGGTVSAEQKEWIGYLNSVGYYAVVCKGHEAAMKEVEWYLSLCSPSCA